MLCLVPWAGAEEAWTTQQLDTGDGQHHGELDVHEGNSQSLEVSGRLTLTLYDFGALVVLVFRLWLSR